MDDQNIFLSNKIFNIKKRRMDFYTKFILFSLFFLLLIKICFIHDYFFLISTFIFEAGLLFLIKILFSSKKIISKIFFYISYFIIYFVSVVNTYFLQDVFNWEFSFFNLDLRIIPFFFKNVLPTRIILFFALSMIFIYLLSKYIKINSYIFSLNLNKKYLYTINLILLLLLLFLVPFLATNFSSPIVNTVNDLFDFKKGDLEIYNMRERENISFDKNISQLDKSMKEYPKNKIKYNYIFLFVGETVLDKDFSKKLHSNNFFSKNINDSIYYNNYYTNAQDSRSALMSLLSSVFIPYEGYTANWQEKFSKKVVNMKNLVDCFNINDYNTSFAISSVETPVVGNDYNWNKRIHFSSKEEYNLLKEKYLCLYLLKHQHGCEDLSLLSKIKEDVKNSNRLFLLQEFVFGHNKEYEFITKEDRIDYYSKYISKFYSFLEDENILNQSLIIFLGDHGDKGISLMKKRSNLNIPLIFINSNLSKHKYSSFYTHTDFKDLLFNNILENYNKDINSKFTYVMGPTNSSYLTYLDSNNLLTIDLLKKDVLKNSKDLNANYIYNVFYSYQMHFVSLREHLN